MISFVYIIEHIFVKEKQKERKNNTVTERREHE